MLTTSDQDARQNGMSRCPTPGAVAAIGFASDDRRAQHMFCLIVGGVQLIGIQEPQQMRAVFAQAFGKAGIVAIGQPALRCDQNIQARLQSLGTLEEGKWVQAGFLLFQSQRLLQDGCHLAGKVQSPTCLALLHLLQFFQQVSDTFLLQPDGQSLFIIGQITVRSQDALELLPPQSVSTTTSLLRLSRMAYTVTS